MTGVTAASWLYVPATRPERVSKAQASGADAVILDLEDAVPPGQKDAARDALPTALSGGPSDTPVWVRINADAVADDLAALEELPVAGLVVPKAEPGLLDHVDTLLSARRLPVVALVETAVGVLHAESVGRHPRVVRLAIGEADLAGELRLGVEDPGTELAGIRLQVVLASSAAGLVAPIGPVERDLSSVERLAATTRTLLRQGFRGRTALHPRQVEHINATFRPSEEEVADARQALRDFESGTGAEVGVDGRFVDRAVIRWAREVLERAGASADSTVS